MTARPVPRENVRLTGWGRTAASGATLLHPETRAELAATLDEAGERGLIARGLGRSYGDGAQNAGGHVGSSLGVSGITHLDRRRGIVTALAGTSIEELITELVPLGYFVPVSPGTRHVTVGGAIAADAHGKNHHRVGSWCNSVRSLTLATPARGILTVTPETEPDLFWATAGGMGLTGVILDATFDLVPIETSLVAVDTDRTPDLDTVLDLMSRGDHTYDYSVAWIDLLARGASLGRSVLTRGRFARLDELPRRHASQPLAFRAGTLATAPPIFPGGLLNPLTVRAFNEFWFRRAPRRRRGEIQSITQFFHPLDLVDDWNRIYGPAGFLQWQCVVPLDAVDDLRRMIERIAGSGRTSFLAVLKRCGPGNPGHLSFPIEGWTLALDIPIDPRPDLGPLLDDLDERVAAAGGRNYLAKDSRMRAELMPVMYPRLDEWRGIVADVDPDGHLRSDLARRLRLRPNPTG